MMLSPNSCARYFKLGSTTRRNSVIGCLGYENASPCITCVETAEIGVGTSTCDDGCNTCAICLESINSVVVDGAPQKNIATTECGHTFCLSCLLENLHTSNLCPLCRAPIEKNVKKVLKPLSYSEGIGLLNHELNGLRIYEDIEQYVQNAMEVSSESNTNGQNVQDVIDDVMNMVTNFGFNLLYDATLHTNGGDEREIDHEWVIQMYNNDSETDSDSGSESAINQYNGYNSDSDSDSESNSNGSGAEDEDDCDESESEFDGDNGGDGDESEKKRIVLPEVPESMLE